MNASRSFTLVTAAQGAITGAVTKAQIGSIVTGVPESKFLACQASFTYGSGGTTAKFYVQTSLDGGVTWIDIMSFAFATAMATKVSAVRFGIALAAGVTPSNGALADNTILDGLLGDRIQVIATTTGTYAGGTSIAISAVSKG